MSSFLAALLNSLDIGILLFVIAVGLNIIFGVLNVVNFAHGALYMLGAYFTYTIVGVWGIPYWPSLLLAPLAVAAATVVLERLVLQHVYGRDITDSLLLTFALLLAIDDLVKMIWGSGIHVVKPPPGLRDTILLFGVRYPVYNLFIIGVGLLLILALWVFFNRTRAGRVIRAVSVDREMADMVGINVPLVIAGVFALGTWLAAVGGVIAAPIRTIGPGMGDKVIIESFIVVVIGGLGSFPGTFLGAIILGLIHGLGGRFLPQISLVLPYLGMALVLLVKPRGLMGRSGS